MSNYSDSDLQEIIDSLGNDTERELARELLEKRAERLKAEDVEWVVNSLAELGVKIGNQFFFLYKGYSLVYELPGNEFGNQPTAWRPVGKREFGETCNPLNRVEQGLVGTVSQDDSLDWRPLPPAEYGAKKIFSPVTEFTDQQCAAAALAHQAYMERPGVFKESGYAYKAWRAALEAAHEEGQS